MRSLPDAGGVVAGAESFGTAWSHFEANLGAMGLNPASLENQAKHALLNASAMCLSTFTTALGSNPTSVPASSPQVSSSAPSKA